MSLIRAFQCPHNDITYRPFVPQHQRRSTYPKEDHDNLQHQAAIRICFAMASKRILAKVACDTVDGHDEGEEGCNYYIITVCQQNIPESCRLCGAMLPPRAIAGVTLVLQYPRCVPHQETRTR